MDNIDRDYLINQLESGRTIDCLYMMHNAYQSRFSVLNKRYDNSKFECIGSSVSYLKVRCRTGYVIQNHDFIMLYGDTRYRDYEFNEMKNIAKKISEENNKRVSVGYSYIIPADERKQNGISEEIKFVSFNDGDEYEEILQPSTYHDPIELASLVIQKHDLLENQKVKKHS